MFYNIMFLVEAELNSCQIALRRDGKSEKHSRDTRNLIEIIPKFDELQKQIRVERFRVYRALKSTNKRIVSLDLSLQITSTILRYLYKCG